MLLFMEKRSNVTISLIAVNCIVFLITSLMGGGLGNPDVMLKAGAMYEPLLTQQHEYYRLFTSCFLHFGIQHLVNNMIVLYAAGDRLERMLGSVRFLVLYLAAGLLGNVVSLAWHIAMHDYVVSAGASGAIFGIVGALVFAFVRNIRLIPGAALKRLAVWSLVYVLLSLSDAGVDHLAHAGGFVSGFALCALLYHPRRSDWRAAFER